ncbi:hypothetical protein AB0D11_02110 [Streptomyces monashensis]|uniref:DUF6197 family protein n=1 Tax=Streptomyces monashensis TaxID=1678012 RepID=UPI0033F5DEFE
MSTVSLAVIADFYDRAADHIEKVGWTQNDLWDVAAGAEKPPSECPVCAWGALNVALHGTPRFRVDYQLGELTSNDVAVHVEHRLGGVELADWNDDPARTQAEVTGLFRETAAELRGGAR